MGPNGWMWAGHGWGMALWALALLVFWGGVLAAVLVAVRSRRRAPEANPLQILDERLARGEIDIEAYRSRRRQIVDGH